MGKYMRRKRGGAGAGDSSSNAVLGGIRTRSRAAAAATAAAVEGTAKRRKQAATTARVVDEAVCGQDDGAGCYLRLRSRRLLFKAAVVAVAPRGDLGAAEEEASTERLLAGSGEPGEAVVVGISRCSSTASSTVDVAATERSGGGAEACDVESSVSDSECAVRREMRETTPSSRPPVGSSQATADEQKRKRCCRRNSPTTATTSTAAALRLEPRARMPEAEEVERFFAAAEKAQAQRFAAKYNFDIVLGAPLNPGRFEWTPVTTT